MIGREVSVGFTIKTEQNPYYLLQGLAVKGSTF